MRKLSFISISLFMLVLIGCQRGEDTLKLKLRLDGEKIQGSVESLILTTKENTYFFDDNGVCVKKPRFPGKISPNHQFIAVTDNNFHYLSLYNYQGQLIWKKKYTDYVSVLKVSNDGTRVYIITSNEDPDNSLFFLKCLNEKGTEIISLENTSCEESRGPSGFSISDNGKFFVCYSKWITGAGREKVWQFYSDSGKKIREQKSDNDFLESINNSGNYLVSIKDEAKSYILYDKNGAVLKRFESDGFALLSRDGETIFYRSNEEYIFEEGSKLNKLSKNNIRSLTKPYGSFCFSFDGNEALLELSGEKDYSLIFMHKNGNIVMSRVSFDNFKPYVFRDNNKNTVLYYVHQEYIVDKQLLFIWSDDYKKCNVFKVNSLTGGV